MLIKEESTVGVAHLNCHLRTSFVQTVEEKPLALVPVQTEVKEEAVTVIKTEPTSAQPTCRSSYLSLQ